MLVRVILLTCLVVTLVHTARLRDVDDVTEKKAKSDVTTPLFEHESALQSKLYESYDKRVAPRIDSGEAVLVKFGMALIDIVNLDFERNTLQTTLWLRYHWHDIRLKWDPQDHGGLSVLRVDVGNLWTPDITLYNTMQKRESLLDSPALAVIYNTGDVLWIPSVRQLSQCGVNQTMEVHQCSFKFGSWAYDGNSVDLGFYEGSTRVDLSDYRRSRHWNVVDSGAKKNVKYYPCCEEPYPDLTFTIKVKHGL